MFAATANLKCCQVLAAYGGDLSALDAHGRTVMNYAASVKDPDGARYNVRERFLQSVDGFQPLQIAATIGVGHIIRWLLCHGNDGDGHDPRKLTHLKSTRNVCLRLNMRPAPLLDLVREGDIVQGKADLIRTFKDAMKVWCPANHWLHPRRLIYQMVPLLAIALRISRIEHASRIQRYALPTEMWLHIGSFLIVRHVTLTHVTQTMA